MFLGGIALFVVGSLSSPMYGSAWECKHVAIASLQPLGASVPDQIMFLDDGADSTGVFAYQFGDEAVNEEQVGFTLYMPRAWREGTDAYFHLHTTPDDATTCNYRVCIEYAMTSNGSWASNTSEQCVTFASDESGVANQHVDFPAISMTGRTIGTEIVGRLYRNSSNAADTCDAKILWVHSIGIHYQIDRPGSRGVDTK